jgi:hypothetical protein
LLALPLSAILAQTPVQTGTPTSPREQTTSGRPTGKTLTGILVSADCNAASMPRSTASSVDPNSTDPVNPRDLNRDRARDINQGTGGTDAQLERTRSMDQTTGTTDRSVKRGTPTDTQYANNQTGEMTNAGKWDRACFIGPTTSSFAFQTQDGRVLHFDSAGDSQIKSQLDSSNRVATKNKIFRVRITGSVDQEVIHLTSIVI